MKKVVQKVKEGKLCTFIVRKEFEKCGELRRISSFFIFSSRKNYGVSGHRLFVEFIFRQNFLLKPRRVTRRI